MIKLLALDLDGTTLNSLGEIPEANRKAIRAAEERGVLVTIATGRRFRDAQPVGMDLALNAPLVTHNGALIKFADSMETVSYSLLSTDTSREIVSLGKSLGGEALVSTDPHGHGTLLYDRVSENNRPLKKYLVWSDTIHGKGARPSVSHVPELEPVLDEHEIIHISFSGTCNAMRNLESEISSQMGDAVTILPTIYEYLDFTLLDILPPDADKGLGVSKIADLNEIMPDEVMAVGDNFNDLHMLEFAGTAVVMGNADPRLLEHGEFYTTLSNDEGGLAAAIERFILV